MAESENVFTERWAAGEVSQPQRKMRVVRYQPIFSCSIDHTLASYLFLL